MQNQILRMGSIDTKTDRQHFVSMIVLHNAVSNNVDVNDSVLRQCLALPPVSRLQSGAADLATIKLSLMQHG